MKVLILLVLITGCCIAKQQPRLYLGSATHPIGTAPLKFTDGQPPIIAISDTFLYDTSMEILMVRRGVISGKVVRVSNDTACKHYLTQTTLLYCPDMNCNTTSCLTCGKILNK